VSVEAEGRYWFPALSGKVKVSASTVVGSEVDLKDDLGMEGENTFDGEVAVRFLSRNRLRASAVHIDLDGDQSVPRTFQFGGQIFNVSTPVQSSLDLTMYRVAYEFDFIKNPLGFLGIVVEARLLDGEVHLRAPSVSLDERKKVFLPLPGLGLVGRIDLPVPSLPWLRPSVTAEVAGVTIGQQGTFVDATAAVRFALVRLPLFSLEIAGGYRYVTLRVEGSDNLGELTLRGPFALVAVTF